MTVIVWEEKAQADREGIFRYLYEEAGLSVASAADEQFVKLAAMLEDNPEAGVKVNQSKKQRKLIVTRFPFIMIYAIEMEEVRILRVLHTARKIASQYHQ